MDRLIVDASMAIAWVHPGQATAESDLLLENIGRGTRVVVPALWFVEVSNALLVLERRGKLTGEERAVALESLQSLAFEVDHEMSALAFTRLSRLATELSLSVHDAVYLELAQRLKLPIACKDGPLREAARSRGVALLP